MGGELMNRFDKEDFNEELDRIYEIVQAEYINDIKEGFLEKAQKEYNKYKLFNDTDLLLNLFNSSIFKSLIEEDLVLVMDYDVNYWVEHIIDEINQMVDFKALEVKELDKEIHELLQSIVIEVVHEEKVFDNDNYFDRNFVEHKYVKRKKKFIREQRLSSQPVVSLINIVNSLSSGILEILTSTVLNYSNWTQGIIDDNTAQKGMLNQSIYTDDFLKEGVENNTTLLAY